ncbi:hypothetical protein V6N11_055649 [Hibiscus sabdariffa]|uniref:Uncharacterized protein n=1 Tax=Hibiscus sabdariffa TaxID=183260 RepID=A0ABR2NRF3_9ROSI
MSSSSMGIPAAFNKGFNLQDVADGLYGRHLHVYSWSDCELKQTYDLGDTSLTPLEDPKNPVLAGQVWVGGLIQKGSPIVVTEDEELSERRTTNDPVELRWKQLFLTNSLFSTWDGQFYLELVEKGSHILQINVDMRKLILE